MKWEKVKLGDVIDTCLGKMLDKNKNHGVYQPYLANLNVRWGSFSLDNLEMMKFEESENERYGLKYGDLVICEGGEPGRCAVWKNAVPNMKIQKALHRVRTHQCLYNFYLYYWFLLAGKTGELEQYFTGATIKHMPAQKLREVVISLPPLPIQQRIASILSAYDDLIENNQKQIKLLEEAAQRLYKEWFVDLRFPGHEGVRVVDGVPEGWKKTRLDEVTTVLKRGISPKYDENGEFTVINQKCIRKNVVEYSESRKQSKKYAEELQLQENDTVICSTGIGTLGRVGQIYNVYPNSTFDSHVTLVRANNLIGKQFLFWSLKLLQPYLMSLGKGSTNQQELYKTDLAVCLLLLPAEYLMSDFEKKAQELHDIIAVKTKQISSLREARDRLLPKLMSGEIEV